MAKFLRKAIKHPGKLTEEAKRSGRSKMEQARHDAHSSNPHTRGRGILGERLLRGEFRKKGRSKKRGRGGRR